MVQNSPQSAFTVVFLKECHGELLGLLSADTIQLHHEETILGHHFLLFKAYSITES